MDMLETGLAVAIIDYLMRLPAEDASKVFILSRKPKNKSYDRFATQIARQNAAAFVEEWLLKTKQAPRVKPEKSKKAAMSPRRRASPPRIRPAWELRGAAKPLRGVAPTKATRGKLSHSKRKGHGKSRTKKQETGVKRSARTMQRISEKEYLRFLRQNKLTSGQFDLDTFKKLKQSMRATQMHQPMLKSVGTSKQQSLLSVPWMPTRSSEHEPLVIKPKQQSLPTKQFLGLQSREYSQALRAAKQHQERRKRQLQDQMFARQLVRNEQQQFQRKKREEIQATKKFYQQQLGRPLTTEQKMRLFGS